MAQDNGKAISTTYEGEVGIAGRLRQVERKPGRRNAPGIMETIRDIFKDVPQEEWDRLPPDLSHNHDHYLYGHPTR